MLEDCNWTSWAASEWALNCMREYARGLRWLGSSPRFGKRRRERWAKERTRLQGRYDVWQMAAIGWASKVK